MSQESAKTIPESERCEVCSGEGIVAYILEYGFSEPMNCYKCDGTGRRPPHPPVEGGENG